MVRARNFPADVGSHFKAEQARSHLGWILHYNASCPNILEGKDRIIMLWTPLGNACFQDTMGESKTKHRATANSDNLFYLHDNPSAALCSAWLQGSSEKEGAFCEV